MDDPTPLPSPKRKGRQGEGLYGWSPAYAGFSPEFAEAVLERFSPTRRHRVIDPFVGSGTSAIASLFYPCKFIGVDLDPFSALLSKAKCLAPIPLESVHALVDGRTSKNIQRFSEETHSYFLNSDLEFAASVFGRIERRVGQSGEGLWEHILQNPDNSLSAEIIVLAALLISAKMVSMTSRGSNPVWIKRMVSSPEKGMPSLKEACLNILPQMVNDLEENAHTNVLKKNVHILNCDFAAAPLRSHSVDYLITSPPYLSRLDYVVSHLPELLLLSGLMPISLTHLRQRMMGTTKMLSVPSVNIECGTVCQDVLDAIRSHDSKASGTYYIRFYLQYFAELLRFIKWSKKIMRPSALGFLVVQDSYYKELRVPVADILREMANALEIGVEIARSDEQHNHIGSMDPKQRAYSGKKVLREEALLLYF